MSTGFDHDEMLAELQAQSPTGPATLEPDDALGTIYTPSPGDDPQQVLADAVELPPLEGAAVEADEEAPETPPQETTPEAATPAANTVVADRLRDNGWNIPPGTSDDDAVAMVTEYVARLQGQSPPAADEPEQEKAAPEAFNYGKVLAERYAVARLSGTAKEDAETRIAGIARLAEDLDPLLSHKLSEVRQAIASELDELRQQVQSFHTSQARQSEEQVLREFLSSNTHLGTLENPNPQFLAALKKFSRDVPLKDRLESAMVLSGVAPAESAATKTPTSPSAGAKASTFEQDAKIRQYSQQPRRGKPQRSADDGEIDPDTLLHDAFFNSQ